MKKTLPIILGVVVVCGALFYFITSSTTLPTQQQTSQTENANQNSAIKEGMIRDASQGGSTDGTTVGAAGDSEGVEDPLYRPATEIYKNAEEALRAIKNGSVDYDDRILEQFTEIPEPCTWCGELYAQVKALMLAPESTKEQKSYFAEILAISGKIENVTALVDAIKAAPNQETQAALTEALELTVGNDDITRFLGEQLPSAGEELKESLVAAVTNQGSRLAAETLYKATLEKGDASGFYASGIGLGELVPNEAAMPFLQELVVKNDQYSHLAVKSLLNSGLDGFKLAMSSINNPVDDKIFKDAIDHVVIDDETKEYLEQYVQNEKNPVKLKFAQDALELAKGDGSEEALDVEAPEGTETESGEARAVP
jgi:hypothetical protein